MVPGGGTSTRTVSKMLRELGNIVRDKWTKEGTHNPRMAAAVSHAITERIPLVDFVLDVRDARIPLSSEHNMLRTNYECSAKRIVVLNKMDLTNRLNMKEWSTYFDDQNFICQKVNSHNKKDVQQLLAALQSHVRKLRHDVDYGYAATLLMVGIPNVGKSALAKSLHKIGRISAEEKGKLKYPTISPHPGETKNITSYKIGSNPDIYVLDTPGVLSADCLDVEICSKLALTGAIRDSLIWEKEAARCFLAVLNKSDEYLKWKKKPVSCNNLDSNFESPCGSEPRLKPVRQHANDHTQDSVVHVVRQKLLEMISCMVGDIESERDLGRLIDMQLAALKEVLAAQSGPCDDVDGDVAIVVAHKLLNLFRTGRLGHYTLDFITPKTVLQMNGLDN